MTLVLRKYQEEIVDRFKNEDFGGLFLSVGTGKSAALIGVLKHKIQTYQSKRILIVAPSSVVPSLEKEFKKFYPDCQIPIHVSYGSKTTRKKYLENFIKYEDSGIIITNYEVATSSLGPIIASYKPDTLCFDECHALKNPSSKRAKFFSKLRQDAQTCFIMTGTIIANKITDAFMPMFIMDKGETFGKNFYVFQDKYCYDKNAQWRGNHGYFPNYVLRKDKLPEFKEKLSRHCVTVNRHDVLDLPPLHIENRYALLNADQTRAYKELQKLLVTEIQGETITVENALTKMLRFCQISSGHIGTGEDLITFEKIGKDDVFKEIVEEIRELKGKFIVWTCFKASVVRVTKLLNELGITKIAYITGEQSGEEKVKSETMFKEDPECEVVVANLKAAASGLNLQEAGFSIYFERNFSFTDMYQSAARNYRSGSEMHKQVVHYNIITKETVEEDIVDTITLKQELSDYVLGNIEEFNSVEKEFKAKILKDFGL